MTYIVLRALTVYPYAEAKMFKKETGKWVSAMQLAFMSFWKINSMSLNENLCFECSIPIIFEKVEEECWSLWNLPGFATLSSNKRTMFHTNRPLLWKPRCCLSEESTLLSDSCIRFMTEGTFNWYTTQSFSPWVSDFIRCPEHIFVKAINK